MAKQPPLILELRRFFSGSDGTFGRLLHEGRLVCYTLEKPWKENRSNISCIPTGEYRCVFNYSPAFRKNLYLLMDVPGRSGIRIHTGNYAGDRELGKRSDSLGCILPGQAITRAGAQAGVLRSALALNEIYELTNGNEFYLNISGTGDSNE